MSDRRLIIALAVLCASCERPAQRPARPAAGGPRIQATVVTIRTTIQPPGTNRVHTLVIAGDRARSTGEQDLWRVFDTKANTVTFVDDAARTVRTEALSAILERRRVATAGSLSPHYPRLRLKRTGTTRAIQNVPAEQSVIESGEYRRELWMAEHPSIPRGLFAMMQASEPPSSPLAPMTRAVDDALANAKGFPLLDRTRVPFEKHELVVERAVVTIDTRSVPEALIKPPKDYLDLTPKPKRKPR